MVSNEDRGGKNDPPIKEEKKTTNGSREKKRSLKGYGGKILGGLGKKNLIGVQKKKKRPPRSAGAVRAPFLKERNPLDARGKEKTFRRGRRKKKGAVAGEQKETAKGCLREKKHTFRSRGGKKHRARRGKKRAIRPANDDTCHVRTKKKKAGGKRAGHCQSGGKKRALFAIKTHGPPRENVDSTPLRKGR